VDDEIQQFMETSKKINSRTLSSTRLIILTLLTYFQDGLQFRELKLALGISDGKLFANLALLQKMGYIRKFTVEFDHKTIDVFAITGDGKKEVLLMTSWANMAEKIVRMDYLICQQVATR
jgi:DNA-binding MarR family transcriptional regulator